MDEMMLYHCKRCKREWESPERLGSECERCKHYGAEGSLPDASKKHLLFAGDHYYPCGGMDDLKGSFNTIDEAVVEIKRNKWDDVNYHWYQIVDRDTMEIITSSEC